MSHKYAVIQAHRQEFPITLRCRRLDVSTTGFYAAQTRMPSRHAPDDERLRVDVRSVFQRAQRRSGAPRVLKQLRTRGVRIGQKRVARLMRDDGLVARRTRRFVHTTDSAPPHAIVPNLLARAQSRVGQ